MSKVVRELPTSAGDQAQDANAIGKIVFSTSEGESWFTSCSWGIIRDTTRFLLSMERASTRLVAIGITADQSALDACVLFMSCNPGVTMTLKLTKFFSSASTHPCQSDDGLCIQLRNKSVASVNMVSENVKSASSDDLVPQPIKASTVFTTSGLAS